MREDPTKDPTKDPTREEWSRLLFGSFSLDTVKRCITDPTWQRVRISLLYSSQRDKLERLESYIAQAPDENTLWTRKVQVTNYVNALKRGGLIK